MKTLVVELTREVTVEETARIIVTCPDDTTDDEFFDIVSSADEDDIPWDEFDRNSEGFSVGEITEDNDNTDDVDYKIVDGQLVDVPVAV